ncbi:hypothetical protein RhiirA4_474007 [Rhizophagus irregularis]|uniref:Uncharacterized protein n=1 Tax=Rhizophagus irregularis TaxID=588596 RepID=A0A2I1H7S1_9GLOM|nr:hypothetical protein RhiirA4_474007 [Rhizophagus irregularis]
MPLNKTNKRTRQIEPEQNVKSKGGHPQSSVWEHFIKAPLSTADCLNVNDEIRREYIQKILQLYNDNDDTENNKRSRIQQLNITDFWDVDQNSVKPLSKQKQETIDQCLLKVFVCCGTPLTNSTA